MIDKLLIIPDTQVKKGVPIQHIIAAGRYVVDVQPDVIVIMGDWWDCPSLSRYATNLSMEGAKIKDDIKAGKQAMAEFFRPLKNLQARQRANKKRVYKPRIVYLNGNHDPSVRITRYIEQFPILEGMLVDDTRDWMERSGIEVYDFLDIVNIEGIRFSHYHVNPHSAKAAPIGGTIDNMLKCVGYSFVQGHKQGLQMGKHYLSDGTKRLGIVCGSFYMHEEDFMNKQGNRHWHGIVALNEVKDGCADICEISLEYLMEKYGN